MPSPRSLRRSRRLSRTPTPPSSPTLPVAPPRAAGRASDLHTSYTQPPPGALVFEQHVHRSPRKMSRMERTKMWYDGLLFALLEAWEGVLIHALLLALVAFTYLALSRLFAPAHLARLDARLRWYLTGVASAATGLDARGFAARL